MGLGSADHVQPLQIFMHAKPLAYPGRAPAPSKTSSRIRDGSLFDHNTAQTLLLRRATASTHVDAELLLKPQDSSVRD